MAKQLRTRGQRVLDLDKRVSFKFAEGWREMDEYVPLCAVTTTEPRHLDKGEVAYTTMVVTISPTELVKARAVYKKHNPHGLNFQPWFTAALAGHFNRACQCEYTPCGHWHSYGDAWHYGKRQYGVEIYHRIND